ncbi:unnamed protein product [Urochloa humidicola]
MLLFSFMYFSQSSDSSFSSFFLTPPFASGRHAAAATSAATAAAAALSRVLLPQLLAPSSADAANTLSPLDTLLCLSSTPTYVTQLAADLSGSELSHTVSTADLRSVILNAAAASPLPSPRGRSPSEAASSIGGLRNPRLRLDRRLRRRWPSDVVSGRERGEMSSASSSARSPARSSKESWRPPDRSDIGSCGGGGVGRARRGGGRRAPGEP